jgi:hypothetical protein
MTLKGAAMFDDIPGFLDGTGPTTTVFDNDGTPNNILDATLGGAVEVDWQFAGSLSAILGDVEFTATLVADPVSVDPKLVLGSISVIDASGNYSVTFPIAPNSLNPDAYRLTVVITSIEVSSGGSLPIAGFVDGPIIQVRPGP